VTILVGVFLPITDFFIVNIALPTIDRNLHSSEGMLQLVVAGYAVAYALLLVIGGRIGDAFGRRRLFLLGMAGFTVTSLACGLAPTIGLLVAARALQGAAAAMMLPQVLSTIQAATTGAERARALGSYGATGGVATVVGQLLGGLIVTANIAGTGWRPIFLVNVPVGVVGLIVASRVVPDTRSTDPAPVDAPGTALLGLTILSLLIPMTEGRSLGWPAWTIGLLAVFPLAAAAFVFTELRVERGGGVPLVPVSVVRVPSMGRGLLTGVPFFIGFGGFMFVNALTLQDGARFSALKTGLVMVPMAIGFFASSMAMARLVARYGRTVITAGALLQAIGLVAVLAALFGTWPRVSVLALLPGMLVAGLGQGLVLPSLFRLVLSEVPAHQAGIGSGVLTTMQQTSLALGVATLGSLYLTEAAPSHAGPLDAAGLVLVILVAAAILVAVMSRRLPD
jgi:MFS family permease